MKELFLGCYEKQSHKVNEDILFLCSNILKTPSFKKVGGFVIGGSHAQKKSPLDNKLEQEDVDIDVLFYFLPNNQDLSNICSRLLETFQEKGHNLDVRYLIDVFGNHAVLNEKTPGCVPVEIFHDFTRKDIEKIYSKEHPNSPFIVRNKALARLFFLM